MTVSRSRKLPHTEAEQAELAVRLQAMYPAGMPVTTWVKQRHADLTKLTKGLRSWSWDEIAAVLNRTTIRYEAGARRSDGAISTGRWTGPMLKSVVQKGRVAERLQAATQSPRTIEEAARAAAEATIAALLARGWIAPPDPPGMTSREAVQHLGAPTIASLPAPALQLQPMALPEQVRVFGAVEPGRPRKTDDAVQRLAVRSRPVVKVFGDISAEPPPTEAEPGSVQQMVNEKNARAQSIIDSFLNRRKDDGSQG